MKAGLTPAQALAATTTNAAALLGKGNELGKIAPGYFADFVAVEGDPLKDINVVINNVRWVMKGGAVVLDKTEPGQPTLVLWRASRTRLPKEGTGQKSRRHADLRTWREDRRAADGPSAIDPPYNSTRSATIARPRPEPGAASSARTPRCSTASLQRRIQPGTIIVHGHHDVTASSDDPHLDARSPPTCTRCRSGCRASLEIFALACGRSARARRARRSPRARSAWIVIMVRARPSADVSTWQRADGLPPDAEARACAR